MINIDPRPMKVLPHLSEADDQLARIVPLPTRPCEQFRVRVARTDGRVRPKGIVSSTRRAVRLTSSSTRCCPRSAKRLGGLAERATSMQASRLVRPLLGCRRMLRQAIRIVDRATMAVRTGIPRHRSRALRDRARTSSPLCFRPRSPWPCQNLAQRPDQRPGHRSGRLVNVAVPRRASAPCLWPQTSRQSATCSRGAARRTRSPSRRRCRR